MFTSSYLSSCSFNPPSFEAWIYAVTVHGTCCVLGAVPIGLILWHVKDSKYRRKVVGVFCGVLAALSVPCYLFYFHSPATATATTTTTTIQHHAWVGPFLASTFGFATFFKSLNVAMGQVPLGADFNLKTWLIWFVVMPEPIFVVHNNHSSSSNSSSKTNSSSSSNTNTNTNNNKLRIKELSYREMQQRLIAFAAKILGLFVLLTILLNNKQFFSVVDYDYDYDNDNNNNNNKLSTTTTTILSISISISIIKGYVHIWLIYLWASFCMDFSTLGNWITTGGAVSFQPGFLNPLLTARSLKQAWGLKWNLPVQVLLQRTCYIPFRKYYGMGPNVAALLTFVVSGLLHEYNFYVHNHVAYIHNSNNSTSSTSSVPGKAVLFFAVMGIIMILEQFVWNTVLSLRMQARLNRLPSFVIATCLTLVASLPFEYYFIQSWLDAGFVNCIAQMLPHMTCSQ